MFFSFSPTEILYISSRVLLYVFRFNFYFCVNNGLEKKQKNYKTKKLLLLRCMSRYTFSFTLKLTASPPQKLATFYTWIVKQKDDEIEQSTSTVVMVTM